MLFSQMNNLQMFPSSLLLVFFSLNGVFQSAKVLKFDEVHFINLFLLQIMLLNYI